MGPANTRITPKLEKEKVNASKADEIIAGRSKGKVIFLKMWNLLAPSIDPARSNSGSIFAQMLVTILTIIE